MTQPRKQQIKDVTAKFSLLDPKLLSITSPPVAPGLGLAQSTTWTTAGVNPYSLFLASTVTQAFGGAIDTSPGILIGTAQGPFSIGASSQFGIVIPQLNAGSPIVVTIQASDIVTISGSPVLTTSNLANRINLTLAPIFGTVTVNAGLPVVTGSGSSFLTQFSPGARVQFASQLGVFYTVLSVQSPTQLTLVQNYSGTSSISTSIFAVATNVNGFINLSTPVFGNTSSISVQDISLGVVHTLFSPASTSIISVGTTEPADGIVTVAPDGGGGTVFTRLANGEPCLVKQTKRLHMGGFHFVPDTAIGQSIHGRLSALPGTSVTVGFYTTGILQPGAVTYASNLTSLNFTDVLTLTINEPNFTNPIVLSINFTPISTASSIANVVSLVNSFWAAAVSPSPQQAVVQIPPAPPGGTSTKLVYEFPAGCSFNLQLNGNAVINVPLGPTVASLSSLVAAINTAIAGAGQSAQGSASSTGNGVQIQSSAIGAATSSVNMLPGPAAVAFGPPDMRALNEMGVSPGLYTASDVAQLYGLDEIRFFNPSRASGASIQIAASGPTLAKLGLVAGIYGSGFGSEPAVPGNQVEVLIPESMEFGFVPDDQDSAIQSFLTINRPTTLNPTLGIQNAGLYPILDASGKIPSDTINRAIGHLSFDYIEIGLNKLLVAGDLLQPRISTPVNGSVGYTLIDQANDISTPQYTVRVYMYQGNLVWTTNCSFNGSRWIKDIEGQPASAVVSGNGTTVSKYRLAAEVSPWPDTYGIATGWRENVGLGVNSPNAGFLEPGYGFTDGSTNPLIARIKPGLATSGLTLVADYGRADGTSIRTRLYFEPLTTGFGGSASGGIIRTTNASWNGTTWVKDTPNATASYENTKAGSITRLTKYPANNTWTTSTTNPWQTGWDDASTPAFWETVNPGNSTTVIGGQLNIGASISIGLGATEFLSPRLIYNVDSISIAPRTALDQVPLVGAPAGVAYLTYSAPGYEQNVNARWLSTWQAQNTAVSATQVVQLNTGWQFNYKAITSIAWSTWDTTSMQIIPSANPGASALPNALYPHNRVKAWAIVNCVTVTPTLVAGFGIAGVSYSTLPHPDNRFENQQALIVTLANVSTDPYVVMFVLSGSPGSTTAANAVYRLIQDPSLSTTSEFVIFGNSLNGDPADLGSGFGTQEINIVVFGAG